jgi:hypothetical protein
MWGDLAPALAPTSAVARGLTRPVPFHLCPFTFPTSQWASLACRGFREVRLWWSHLAERGAATRAKVQQVTEIFEFPSDSSEAALSYIAIIACGGSSRGAWGRREDAEAIIEEYCNIRHHLGEMDGASAPKRGPEARAARVMRQVRQRVNLYSLWCIRAAGSELAPEPFRESFRSIGGVVGMNFRAWSTRLMLNKIGAPASPREWVHDLRRRVVKRSKATMHMAHGLMFSCPAVFKCVPDFDDVDTLLALMRSAEDWVWQAVELAEAWRNEPFQIGYGPEVSPSEMIELKRAS